MGGDSNPPPFPKYFLAATFSVIQKYIRIYGEGSCGTTASPVIVTCACPVMFVNSTFRPCVACPPGQFTCACAQPVGPPLRTRSGTDRLPSTVLGLVLCSAITLYYIDVHDSCAKISHYKFSTWPPLWLLDTALVWSKLLSHLKQMCLGPFRYLSLHVQ